MDIDKLYAAKQYYQESLGFTYIEVPWTCPQSVQLKTCSKRVSPTKTDNGLILVGSAEQSFLNLILNGELESGDYQTITPCFRNDKQDELHQLYFTKLELISYWTEINPIFPLSMAEMALNFFKRYLDCVIIEMGDLQYDIISSDKGVELGSYGTRFINEKLMYTYGTGLALPRLNYVLSH